MSGPKPRPAALVINTAFLGDVILTVPLYGVLADAGWDVDALVIPGCAPVLEGSPDLRRVLTYDKAGDGGPGGLLRVVRWLRQRYDAVLTPHRSARSALLSATLGAPTRVGYRPPNRPFPPGLSHRRLRPTFSLLAPLCFNRRLEYGLGLWEGRRAAELARGLGLALPEELPRRLWVDPDAARRLESILHDLPRPRLVCFPGSVRRSKRYPVAGWVEALRGVLAERECGVVVCGSPAEAAEVGSTAAGLPGARPLHDLDLGLLKALTASADLVLCNDSAPLHLAVCLGAPVVAVYGPTDPRFGFRAPQGHPHRNVLLEGLPCRPCRLTPPADCPLGHHRCLVELDAAGVTRAALELLSGSSVR